MGGRHAGFLLHSIVFFGVKPVPAFVKPGDSLLFPQHRNQPLECLRRSHAALKRHNAGNYRAAYFDIDGFPEHSHSIQYSICL